MICLKNKNLSQCARIFSLVLMLSFFGCSSDSDTQNTDLSSNYKGETSEAALTSENADTLTVNAYDGSTLSYLLQQASDISEKKSTSNTNNDRLLSQIGKKLFQPVTLVKSAIKGSKAATAKPLARTESEVIDDGDGGTASLTININDATGYFTGAITYSQFSEDGVTLDGTSTISGQYSIAYDAISSFSFSLNALEFDFYSAEILTLTGTLDWTMDFEDDTESLTMDMIILDEEVEKTYWFDNYHIVTVMYDNGISQIITGRYYDYDFGYVDISTPASIFTYYDDSWPVEGIFRCDGSNGTWARLVFDDETTLLQVDSNGNGTIDYETDVAPEVK